MNNKNWKERMVVDFIYSGIEDDVEMIDGSYVGCMIDVMEDVVIDDVDDVNYGWNKKCWEVEILEVIEDNGWDKKYRGMVMGRDEKVLEVYKG